MAEPDVPIDEAQLWDILGQGVTKKLAAGAPERGEPGPGQHLAFFAKMILQSADQKTYFLDGARRFIGSGIPSERRKRAKQLAVAFGARTNRLIDYLKLKGVM
jgi:hypothetical protein